MVCKALLPVGGPRHSIAVKCLVWICMEARNTNHLDCIGPCMPSLYDIALLKTLINCVGHG